jgi:hypothetical protein
VRRMEAEIRASGGLAYLPDLLFRVLVEAGYDPAREPSAETVKTLLAAACRYMRRLKSKKNGLPVSPGFRV